MNNDMILVNSDELQRMIRDTIFEAVSECLPDQQSSKEYYTQKDLAEKWNVSVQTIWRYTKMGRLKATRIGRLLRYKKDYIDNLEELAAPKDGGTTYWTKVEQVLKKNRHFM